MAERAKVDPRTIVDEEQARLKQLNLLQQAGAGIRNTVVPTIVNSVGQIADAATMAPRLGVGALRNIVSGFTGDASVPTNIPSIAESATALPMAAPMAAPTNAQVAGLTAPTERADRMGNGIIRVGGNAPIPAGIGIPRAEAFTNVAPADRVISNVGVQYTPQDLQLKDNIAQMDKIVAAGGATPEQLAQIQGIKQQAGYLRGGTDRGPLNPDRTPMVAGMRSNPNVVASKGGIVMSFPQGTDQAVIDTQRALSAEMDKGRNDPQTAANWALQKQQFDARNTVERPTSRIRVSPGRALEAQIEREKMAQAAAISNRDFAAGAPGRAASTALTQKQADALPESTAAEVEYKKAKTEEAKVAAKSGNFKVIDNTPDILGNPKQNQILDVRTGKMVPQAAGTGQEGLPKDAAQRVVGQQYIAPNGKRVVWDGKGLKEVK